MFKTGSDRLENLISEAYKECMVQDETLFTWLLSIIFESILPRLLSWLPEEYNSFIMMAYIKTEPMDIYEVNGLLYVQEAQLDKYHEELAALSATTNIVQGANHHHKITHSSSSGYQSRGKGKPGRGRGNGASHHITSDLSNLQYIKSYGGPNKVVVGNGNILEVKSLENSKFQSFCKSRSLLHLADLLHVPHITRSLISISKFAKDNKVYFEFHPNTCFVKSQESNPYAAKGI
ncbi:hypothetical protein KIW84_076616 [Lathyrus oleraceus]|uniref:Retrovirus-related Pol polyprotein from transposon TNT 1-94-like beta-barrel domain-containing protein n=1 Tax=Pisum sativum TaxID=3888 RepID=A0A9D4ZZQ1_PEA|nr:hypothetical protein KIW84_076616 [Pisum sativum]